MVRAVQRNFIIFIIVGLVLLGVSGAYMFLKKQTSLPLENPPSVQSEVSKPPSEVTAIPQDANITVISPGQGETVQLPMIITGQARVFENVLSYRIIDENGATLSSGNTMADSPDTGQFGPYTITIRDLGEFTKGKISIEVFQNSAKDGSEIDKVIVPVDLQ